MEQLLHCQKLQLARVLNRGMYISQIRHDAENPMELDGILNPEPKEGRFPKVGLQCM